jgi:hypothetical protein
MQGYLYCTSNRDREGEFTVGFTCSHVSAVILQPDEYGHAKPIRLEFAKAISYGADALDAVVRLLSRYARRLPSSPNVYVFADVLDMQIYEFFDAVYGNWCNFDIPVEGSAEPNVGPIVEEPETDDTASEISCQSDSSRERPLQKSTTMSRSFTHGMLIRHVLKGVRASSNTPFREGSILEAAYCATTGKLVDGAGTKYNSISGLAKANYISAKRPRSVNGWDHCKYQLPDGTWAPVENIRNQFA